MPSWEIRLYLHNSKVPRLLGQFQQRGNGLDARLRNIVEKTDILRQAEDGPANYGQRGPELGHRMARDQRAQYRWWGRWTGLRRQVRNTGVRGHQQGQGSAGVHVVRAKGWQPAVRGSQ